MRRWPRLLHADSYVLAIGRGMSTDRSTADADNLEWVTPGHPLFEALRRQSVERGQDAFAKGACFHSIDHESPSRLDFYRARVVDGLGQVIHEAPD